MSGDVGVYVHVPFCERVCPYCDFAVVARPRLAVSEADRLVTALQTEIEARQPAYAGRELATIYLGGGTPSLLPAGGVHSLIQAIRSTFPGQPEEVTLEVNPSTVERERLAAFVEAGVTRFSLGVQSFDDDLLRRLGRAHRAEEAKSTIEAAREAGVSELSLDLIFGIHEQTLGQLDADLESLLSFTPDHVSAYGLTVEAGTPLAKGVSRGQIRLPESDRMADMMSRVAEALEGAGLRRYETSSYARVGREARHNRRYWARAPVLGVGVGAHSSEAPAHDAPFGRRRSNERDLQAWLARIESGAGAQPPEFETLDETAARAEAGFLALRTRQGLDGTAFEAEFGVSVEACWPTLGEPLRAGLLERSDAYWRLTDRGWLLSDLVFEHLV